MARRQMIKLELRRVSSVYKNELKINNCNHICFELTPNPSNHPATEFWYYKRPRLCYVNMSDCLIFDDKHISFIRFKMSNRGGHIAVGSHTLELLFFCPEVTQKNTLGLFSKHFTKINPRNQEYILFFSVIFDFNF